MTIELRFRCFDAPLFGWLFVIESGGKLVMTTSYMIKNLGLHVLYKSNVAVFLQ